jgi:hypothetical protein
MIKAVKHNTLNSSLYNSPILLSMALTTAVLLYMAVRETTLSAFGQTVSSSSLQLTRLTVTPFPASFWFVKTYKVGGTTMSGVLIAAAAG